MKFSWDKVEKIFRLFFPEFSNKVTWIVVISGIGITSTSILEKIIQAVFEKTYDIKITDGNDAIVGLFLVAFGLIHNIVLQREKTKIELASSITIPVDNTEQLEHDKETFRYLNGIMDENDVSKVFNTLESSHAYYYSQYGPIEKFSYQIEKADNFFINDELNDAVLAMKIIINDFNAFTTNKFSQLSNGINDDYMCLHPYWNCDRGGKFGDVEQEKKYDKSVVEMQVLIKRFKASFMAYRKLVKSKLSI